jgi:GT2 family glycosyltransferase
MRSAGTKGKRLHKIFQTNLADAEDRPLDSPEPTPMARLVTVGVTTFRRPEALARLVASVRRFYPDLPVAVIETDSNLSRGRNLLARAVTTPWMLLCEDDFEFVERTRVEALAEVLAHDPEVSGVGGELAEPNGVCRWAHDYRRVDGQILATPSKDPLRRTPGGVVYQPCDLIYNFGIFRRELFERVAWDEGLPLQEHLEYYWRARRSGARMALARGVAVLHHKDRPTDEYRAFRARNFRDLADVKHGAPIRAEGGYEWPAEGAQGEGGR